MSDIFISYSREDRANAGLIAQLLTRYGWTVWWDREILPGQTFDDLIEKELDSAGCIITLWSTQSVSSTWVKTDAEEARNRSILVPALLNQTKVPLQFRRIQTANLSDWQGDPAHPGFKDLLKGVRSIIGSPPSKEMMTWNEFVSRIEWICDLCKRTTREEGFNPNVLFGITGGGMILADLVGRTLFRGTPVLSLWADRFCPSTTNSSYWFFDNLYNTAVADAIHNLHAASTTILLFDDVLATGSTVLQAMSFLKSRLGEQTKFLFMPLTIRTPEYINSLDNYLPYGYVDAKGGKLFSRLSPKS